VDIDQLISEAREGKWQPVHVLAGSERFLVERAVRMLREACLGDGPPGFNDDVFHGRGLTAQTVTSAARTLPMMAQARFVLVRDAEAIAAGELDQLVGYLEDPSPSTCVVFVATKLDGRTKFAKAAKKRQVLTEARSLKGGQVRGFIVGESKARGHALPQDAAEAMADALGSDLSAIDDALERLSLYVGEGQPIDLEAVEACVTRVRTDTIWALVDSVSLRDSRTALSAASSLLEASQKLGERTDAIAKAVSSQKGK